MSDDNENGRGGGQGSGGRPPLTLKPRGGSISAGTVRQSFSHGRSKTVVVETKRRAPRPEGERPVIAAAPAASPPPAPGPPPRRPRRGLERQPEPVAERARRSPEGAGGRARRRGA